ncbi:cholesterol 24-hydroxylase-like [Acanthaster planci]|uniref:Cholesterol 24-hydroxylase-like n=1 Tax=Acanthaster planci TaxID=133434 RepID=A0A8B7YCG0_ACAPL|nr:cholesterol 24-hydroxylase-like [Acanthaster planci]
MLKYGKVYKMFIFQKPIVVVLEPSFLKEVMHSTTHSKPAVEHANFWHVFGSRCFYHGLLTETDVPKYLKRRALFNPAFHRRVCCKSVLGDGGSVGGGDIGEQGDDIKADHDVVWLEGEVLDEGSKLVRVLDVMFGVPHQGQKNFGEGFMDLQADLISCGLVKVAEDRFGVLDAVFSITSHHIQRILHKQGIRVFHTAPLQLHNLFTSHKDRQDPQRRPGVYRIPCQCGKVYIGETGRDLPTRINEHKTHGRKGELEKSSIIKHSHTEDHQINWSQAELVTSIERWYLMQSMDAFNDSVDLLIRKLSKDANGKTEVKMLDVFNKITLDVVAKVAFGLELDDVMEKDSPFTQAILMTLLGIQSQFFEPWRRFSPLSSDRKFRQDVRQAIKYVRATGRRCIEARLEAKRRGEKLPRDLLTYILEASRDFQADSDFNIEEMIDEFFTFFFAGQETTANLMAFILVELGHNPEIYQRVMTEVNAVFGDKERIEYSDLGKLEYLSMVIKETLRLWPPAFGTNREMACDMTVLGYKIPQGTVVWLNTYVMGRVEEFFKNPLVFDPERFCKTEKGEREKNLFTYFPFSMGTRACIGQSFALIEARLIIGRLLHNFKFTLAPGQRRDDILQEITIKPRQRCTNYLTPIR